MSPVAKGPKVSFFHQTGPAFLVLAVAWGAMALLGLVFLAGRTANFLVGRDWDGPTYSFDLAKEVVTKGPAAPWPQAPAVLVWSLFLFGLALIAVPATALTVRAIRRRPVPGDPLGSLAMPADVKSLTPAGVRARAVALRGETLGGTDPRDVSLAEAGVPLGRLQPSGPELRASWEDVAVAVMAPRTGKTSAQAVPAILDAPGAVVVTSNKADVWATTAQLRARQTRQRVWVFDPQMIAHIDRDWWWNPLKGVKTYDGAFRLATHFMQELKDHTGPSRDFFLSAATDLLSAFLLAAGLDDLDLLRVNTWLNDLGNPEPGDILRKHDDEATAASLDGRNSGAPETREGIYEYARTACRCLRNKEITRWVTPPTDEKRRIDEFEPVGFARTKETIYLLSKDGAGAAAPLVAALTDRILVESAREAERRGGRLDPPMVVVLDEAANICRIADLPALYSHLGSRGIFVLTILQSRSQAREVWGTAGFDTLWGAATIKIVGAGIDDPTLADDLSRLVGDHDVTVRSLSLSGGSQSESIALRKQPILAPDAIRAMPKGSALLLATGCKPASLQLQPWYRGPRAAEIERAAAVEMAELTERAKLENVSGGAGGAAEEQQVKEAVWEGAR